MTRLNWADVPRGYEVGVDRGVLYSDGEGVAWNGLISVEEGASATEESVYFDGQRLVVSQDLGDFQATVSAFTYPHEFEEYSGYLESTGGRRFGLSYRTETESGHRLHIVYNALARLPSRAWSTISDSTSPTIFQWELQASSVIIPGASPGSHLVIETSQALPALVETIEGWLYGTDSEAPRLPDPEEIVDIFETSTLLRITYNGDGTYTAEGPDEIVEDNGDGTFEIHAPTAVFLDEYMFQVQSF